MVLMVLISPRLLPRADVAFSCSRYVVWPSRLVAVARSAMLYKTVSHSDPAQRNTEPQTRLTRDAGRGL